MFNPLGNGFKQGHFTHGGGRREREEGAEEGRRRGKGEGREKEGERGRGGKGVVGRSVVT